jgi:hypothetical protein
MFGTKHKPGAKTLGEAQKGVYECACATLQPSLFTLRSANVVRPFTVRYAGWVPSSPDSLPDSLPYIGKMFFATFGEVTTDFLP